MTTIHVRLVQSMPGDDPRVWPLANKYVRQVDHVPRVGEHVVVSEELLLCVAVLNAAAERTRQSRIIVYVRHASSRD